MPVGAVVGGIVKGIVGLAKKVSPLFAEARKSELDDRLVEAVQQAGRRYADARDNLPDEDRAEELVYRCAQDVRWDVPVGGPLLELPLVRGQRFNRYRVDELRTIDMARFKALLRDSARDFLEATLQTSASPPLGQGAQEDADPPRKRLDGDDATPVRRIDLDRIIVVAARAWAATMEANHDLRRAQAGSGSRAHGRALGAGHLLDRPFTCRADEPRVDYATLAGRLAGCDPRDSRRRHGRGVAAHP